MTVQEVKIASHQHVDPDAGDRRVAVAILVNLGLTGAQIIGGILSGSLALIADALHNFSDAISLIIAFAARKIARRPADAAMTFGYGRAEVVAALVNYTTLLLLGLYLLYEAAHRLYAPSPVDGWLMVIIAGVALAVDLVTAGLTHSMSKTSMNMRAAFLHNMADALGSVAVILAGGAIILYDWRLIDPAVTALIAGYILWQTVSELPGVIRVLMLASPSAADTSAIAEAVEGIQGVAGIHHIHHWQVQEHETAVEAHLVIAPGSWGRADAIKAEVKALLAARFDADHSTIELECSAHACEGAELIGHV